MLKQCSCVDRNFMTVFTWSLFCWSPVFTDATVPGNCGPKATISHRSHSASAHSGWLRWLDLRLYFQETYGIPLKKYHEHLTSLPTNLFKHNALYKSQTSDIEHTENTWWRETWPTTPQYRNIKQVHLAHMSNKWLFIHLQYTATRGTEHWRVCEKRRAMLLTKMYSTTFYHYFSYYKLEVCCRDEKIRGFF